MFYSQLRMYVVTDNVRTMQDVKQSLLLIKSVRYHSVDVSIVGWVVIVQKVKKLDKQIS